jgi:hypothetical protein
MSDAWLSESARALENFDKPRWPLAQTLEWIANPKIETLADYEAAFSGRMHARITSQRVRALVRSRDAILGALGRASPDGGLARRNPDAVDELLRALRWDKLRAIDRDNNPLPPEFWDAQSSADPGTWPDVRFLREDVLRLWPAIDTAAAEGGSRASLEAMAGKEAAARLPKQALQGAPNTANGRDMSPAEMGRAGGKKSGEDRRARRKWVLHATDLAKAAYSRDPTASNDRIAEEIADTWKLQDVDCPGHRTLSKFVSELRRDGQLRKRSASLPK